MVNGAVKSISPIPFVDVRSQESEQFVFFNSFRVVAAKVAVKTLCEGRRSPYY